MSYESPRASSAAVRCSSGSIRWSVAWHDRKFPTVLQESLWGGEQHFSGSLKHLLRGDLKDHFLENDYRAS